MRIHHLAFRTRDLPRLERFYVEVLGFVVERRHERRSLWLSAGGSILMLEQKDPAEPDVDPASLELVAFGIDAEEHAFYKDRLDGLGIPIEASTAYTVYFRDPDGRRIALSSYPDPAKGPAGQRR